MGVMRPRGGGSPIPNCWATEKAGEGGTSPLPPGTGPAGSVAMSYSTPWVGRGSMWLWHDACPFQVTLRLQRATRDPNGPGEP